MERKLRLVSPPAPVEQPAAGDDDAPITEEERAAARSLAEAIDDRRDPLALALRAARAPEAIDAEDLDALVARALGDEARATRAEREAAEALASEIDRGALGPEAAILEHLRVAARPADLDPHINEALIEAALARVAKAPALGLWGGKRGGARKGAPITMAAAAGITAIAAGLALFFSAPRFDRTGGEARAALIRARSSQDLFDASTPFPRSGRESARIDRIAAARGSDLRANRFASWGIR